MAPGNRLFPRAHGRPSLATRFRLSAPTIHQTASGTRVRQPLRLRLGLVVLVFAAVTSPLRAQSDPVRPQYGAWGYDTAGAGSRQQRADDGI